MSSRLHGLVLATGLALSAGALAADVSARPGGPGGGGGGKTAPNPDIVYMSGDNLGLNSQSAVRGVAFSTDGATASDMSLYKTADSRFQHAIAWSPDRLRFAWFEQTDTSQSIVVAALGGQPRVVYSVTHPLGQPAFPMGSDGLAWGKACESSDSVIVFPDYSGIRRLNVTGDSYALDPTVLPFPGQAYAFSPTGRHLAYWRSSGISVISLCATPPASVALVPASEIDDIDDPDVFPIVDSIDWAADGSRIAISFHHHYPTIAVDPWRDIKVIDLTYCAPENCTEESVSYSPGNTSLLGASAAFPFESSELSPTWGPPLAGSPCARLAFARSNNQGRYMYLAESKDAACGLENYRQISGKAPRALDWK